MIALSGEKTGRSLDDFDLVELNEAFAAQMLACLKELPIDRDKLNVNGGAVALTGFLIQVVYFGLAWLAMKRGMNAGTTAISMMVA